jgi:hypothetical protein
MQGHKLTLKHKNNKILAPAPTVLWILNADNTHIAGKTYVWKDGSTWDDSKKWKD